MPPAAEQEGEGPRPPADVNGRTPRRSMTCRLLLTLCLLTMAGGLNLPPGQAAPAPPTLRPVVTLGDAVAGVETSEDGFIGVGPLNDKGQLCFSSLNSAQGRVLIQYDQGQFRTIAAPADAGPAGKWPENLWFSTPLSMNRDGSVVFSGLLVQTATGGSGGTFVWRYPERTVTPVAVPGMASVDAQSFEWAAGPAPSINNRGDIAFVAHVKNNAGRSYYGVFLWRSDGRHVPVAVPDQVLPDGKKIVSAYLPTIRDDGVIGLLLKRTGDELELPFLWESGKLTPVPIAGVRAAGKLLIGFSGVCVNDANRSVLLEAQLHSLRGHYEGLFRVVNGKVAPVAVPGQKMPDGGNLLSVPELGVSSPNERGEHAFLAQLEGDATALYRMDADGKVSLLLKSGMTTNLGKVTSVGPGSSGSSWGVGLSNAGEVACVVSIADGPDTLVVLRPGGV
jgi:hypothetical protein